MSILRVSSQDTTAQSATTTVTALWPATPTAKNLLLAVVIGNGASSLHVTNSGWNAIEQGGDTGANGAVRVGVFYKISNGNEISVIGTQSDATAMAISIYEYGGVSPSLTIDSNPAVATKSDTTSITFNSTGTLSQKEELIFAVLALNDTLVSPSWTAGSLNNRTSISNANGSMFVGDHLVSATTAIIPAASWTSTRASAGIVITFYGGAVIDGTALNVNTTSAIPTSTRIVESHLSPAAIATTTSVPLPNKVSAGASVSPKAIVTFTNNLKPIQSGLSDMGGYPFIAGQYPYTISPYTSIPGSGDYTGAVKNRVAAVFWKDLQPTSQGQAIDPTTVRTISYAPGQSEISSGVAKGTFLSTFIADAMAAGEYVKIRVIAGWYAPDWVFNLPYTSRDGNSTGGRKSSLVDSSGNHIMPFWSSTTWNPNNPTVGFHGAYYQLQTALAALYDLNPYVVDVTFSGSLTQETAEPLLREDSDNVQLCNTWFAGLGESVSGAGNDTDTPAVQAGLKAHMAAWKFTRCSFSMGPNRRSQVNRILTSVSVNGTTLTCAGANFTSADDGVLIAGDPTKIPAGTTITHTSSTTATMSNAASTASGLTVGVFNSIPYTVDINVASTISDAARISYGNRYMPGNTSFNAQDIPGVSSQVDYLINNKPFWLQTVAADKLNKEQQKIGFLQASSNIATYNTLGGSFTLIYGGLETGTIQPAGAQWTDSSEAAAVIGTALNALTSIQTDGGVTASAIGSYVAVTWNVVQERVGTLITIGTAGTSNIVGISGPYTASIFESVIGDTLVSMMTAAFTDGGASYMELHPGYADTPQPRATPTEMNSFAGTIAPLWVKQATITNGSVLSLTTIATSTSLPSSTPRVDSTFALSSLALHTTVPSTTLRVDTKVSPSAITTGTTVTGTINASSILSVTFQSTSSTVPNAAVSSSSVLIAAIVSTGTAMFQNTIFTGDSLGALTVNTTIALPPLSLVGAAIISVAAVASTASVTNVGLVHASTIQRFFGVGTTSSIPAQSFVVASIMSPSVVATHAGVPNISLVIEQELTIGVIVLGAGLPIPTVVSITQAIVPVIATVSAVLGTSITTNSVMSPAPISTLANILQIAFKVGSTLSPVIVITHTQTPHAQAAGGAEAKGINGTGLGVTTNTTILVPFIAHQTITRVFFNIVNKTTWINEPNFKRWRHVYRGPRESYKFNSDANAFNFDIRRLYDKSQSLAEYLVSCITSLETGGSFPTVTNMSSQTVSLEGVEDLQSRARRLLDRVKVLERG